MKIVWISKIEWNMPHKTSRLKLSDALRKRGHDVTVYMVRKFGERISSSNNVISVPTIHLPILSGLFFGLVVFFYFPILLKRKNVDVIIIDCTKVLLPFVLPLKILNKTILLDIRTLPIDREDSLIFKFSMRFSRYIADGITTITPELKNILREEYNLTNVRIGLWSSGVSINDFNKTNLNEKSFIQNKIKDRKFILMYHGEYSSTRGIENIIKAIGRLDSPLKNGIKLFIIGMPKNKIDILSKLSENEGVKEQVDILPKVSYSEIAQYLKIADVGVIPLPPKNKWWRVSAPLKTLEYLAASKPVIATNIPFHCRIFEKGNCGVLIESGSPNVIARGITDLFNKRGELQEIGENGLKIVKNYYTWNIMAKKVEDFLKELLN